MLHADMGMYSAFLLAGLLGSAVHCSSMCGSLIAAQVHGRCQSGCRSSFTERLLWPYHLGRISTYALLGAGSQFMFRNLMMDAWHQQASRVLMLLAAGLFLLAALQQVLPSLRRWVGAGSGRWAARWGNGLSILAAPLLFSGKPWHVFLRGMVFGLLPCGMLLAAAMLAATMPNAAAAMVGMILFGLGTTPVLMGMGLAGDALWRRWPMTMQRLGALLLAGNAVLLFRATHYGW